MGYMFGIGDGIWIGVGIILGAIILCIVSSRTKGLPSVVTYLLLAVFAIFVLLWWPIKRADEPPIDDVTKTDRVLFFRIIILIFFFVLFIFLIHKFVRVNLFHVIRAESTADRHGQPWIVEAKLKSMRG